MEAATEDDDWYVRCSDDEIYSELGMSGGNLGVDAWRPSAVEIVTLFGSLEATRGGVLPLEWHCAGRRPPSPASDEEYASDEDNGRSAATATAGAAATASAAPGAPADGASDKSIMDFDVDADESTARLVTPRRAPIGSRELKGSARKKTTDFNNILNNMKRHRQLDAANRAAEAAKTKKD